MLAFVTLWITYGLGWFLISVLAATLRGDHNGMMLRYAMSFGLVTAIFQKLILICINGGC